MAGIRVSLQLLDSCLNFQKLKSPAAALRRPLSAAASQPLMSARPSFVNRSRSGGAAAGTHTGASRAPGEILDLTFRSAAGEKRWLLTHMGMSGSWRIWSLPAPSAHKHDHADIVFGDVLVRYTDPRRFGSILFMTTDPRKSLPLTKLGCEPWDPTLTADRFYTELQKTHRSIKEVLLSGKIVVGCGNIYCSEALFAAGIRPTRPADAISKARAGRLLESVRKP